jgi:hypothetical protein
VNLEIVGEITSIEVIAVGRRIIRIKEPRKPYGNGRWRKLEGVAFVRLKNGPTRKGEIHWYEAHGIGRRRFKIKRPLENG